MRKIPSTRPARVFLYHTTVDHELSFSRRAFHESLKYVALLVQLFWNCTVKKSRDQGAVLKIHPELQIWSGCPRCSCVPFPIKLWKLQTRKGVRRRPRPSSPMKRRKEKSALAPVSPGQSVHISGDPDEASCAWPKILDICLALSSGRVSPSRPACVAVLVS